jgi:Tol biopolymer transport system component
MKAFLAAALFAPVAAHADGYTEAVNVDQISALENTYPAWSPDGTKIVLESTRAGPDPDIYLMNSDGTNVYASEQDGNLDVFQMKADGSEKMNLTRHPGTMDRQHNHEIYTMTLDGGGSR